MRTRASGITLIELLITIGISSGILVMITFFALDISDFGVVLGGRLEDERALEQIIRIFTTEVRSMGPSENGSYPIAATESSTFSFYTDVDADGDFEKVRYFVNGDVLQKGVTEPTGTPATYPPADEIVRDVVNHVASSSVFTYWEQGWIGDTPALTDPIVTSSVRLVRMTVTVDATPSEPPGPVTQSISVTIRNLRGEI